MTSSNFSYIDNNGLLEIINNMSKLGLFTVQYNEVGKVVASNFPYLQSLDNYLINIDNNGKIISITNDGNKQHYLIRETIAIHNGHYCKQRLLIDVTTFINKIESLEETSITDNLTGLKNRGGLRKRIDESLKKNDCYFWMIFADLDKFKDVNDTYGHDVGDEVLKYIALLFKKYFNADADCFRFGGDEFIFVIDEISYENLEMRLQKINEELSSFYISIGNNRINIQTSISFGLSQYNKELTVKDILNRSDAAAYFSKSNGGGLIIDFDQLTIDEQVSIMHDKGFVKRK